MERSRHRLTTASLAATALVGLLVAAPSSASAQWWYVGGTGAKVFIEDETGISGNGATAKIVHNSEYAFSGHGGYAFPFGLRLEGEITYVTADFDVTVRGRTIDVDGVEHLLFMVNAYWDFPIGARWRPYVGVGVGGDHEWHDTGDARSSTNFAYQFKAGVAFAVTPALDVTLGYRYVRTDERQFEARQIEEADMHFVEVGVRYRFGP